MAPVKTVSRLDQILLMRAKGIIAPLVFVALMLPVSLLAKRMPPPVVEPIIHESVCYTVPNDRGTKGYIVASDAKTGNRLWKKTLFRKCICPFLEHDVQWVFIKEMRLEGERLIIVSESHRVYALDLKTRRVQKLKLHVQEELVE